MTFLGGGRIPNMNFLKDDHPYPILAPEYLILASEPQFLTPTLRTPRSLPQSLQYWPNSPNLNPRATDLHPRCPIIGSRAPCPGLRGPILIPESSIGAPVPPNLAPEPPILASETPILAQQPPILAPEASIMFLALFVWKLWTKLGKTCYHFTIMVTTNFDRS